MPAAAHTARGHMLPASLPPRGLSRVQAAAYIGVSPTKFDQMVADGRMPPPKRIDGRLVWDIRRLDISFEALPDEPGRGPPEAEQDDVWARVRVAS